MTPPDTSGRERRAAAREQRRTADGAAAHNGESDGTRAAALAGDALRNAASAAAVGAAVGAARALSARRRHDSDAAPAVEEEHTDGQPEDEPEPDLEREPEPELRREPEPEEERDNDARSEPASADDLQAIVRSARALLGELHGADAESVSSVARTRNGWTVGLEVVEVRRIPDSTDILATYEVELDGDGGVLRFERTRRYSRSEADRGGRG